MKRICMSCRYREAEWGSAHCAICNRDEDDFLNRFQPNRDSIEERADKWAFGLMAVGLLVLMVTAIAAIVMSPAFHAAQP